QRGNSDLRMTPADSHLGLNLAEFRGSCPQRRHFSSRVSHKDSECTGVPTERCDGLTSVLPRHADPLRTTSPLQMQLPHHDQTLLMSPVPATF
uniref:Uncharacterized protein n=1 Tax=Oryzias sinensis TaxID=183150 RepID=A0A8C7Y3F6_9TELE